MWCANTPYQTNQKSDIANLTSKTLWWLFRGCSPLPIPNREVKTPMADGTGFSSGRVGSCHIYLKNLVIYFTRFFYAHNPRGYSQGSRGAEAQRGDYFVSFTHCSTFCLDAKSSKKVKAGIKTACSRQVALWGFCTTVVSAEGSLLYTNNLYCLPYSLTLLIGPDCNCLRPG